MLDITFDLETCALCPTAAVMSIGAVAWNRYDEQSPFVRLKDTTLHDPAYQFSCHIDLRSSFMKGLSFDQATMRWWEEKSDEAKAAVLANDSYELPCRPIERAVKDFFEWIDDLRKETGEQQVCLWAQGSDFDIAILRNICYKFNIEIPVHYTNFRDHRTYYLEGAQTVCVARGEKYDQRKAYDLVVDYEEGKGIVHDPMYDSKRSVFSTWQMMLLLRALMSQGNA